jgi:ribosome-associated protein
LKEQETNKLPKNFRAIFQVLQDLDKNGVPSLDNDEQNADE